jgi:hypothetical protein
MFWAARRHASDPELRGTLRLAVDCVCCCLEVPLCEQVRVDVVVGERAVLVRAGDAVDAKRAVWVVMSEGAPQSRRLDEQLEPCFPLELVVTGGGSIARNGVGDVCADVERRGARRPVAGALVAADRAPRERGAGKPELPRPFTRQVERCVAPPQRVSCGCRHGVGEHRQHEALGVPECVAVVARSREALGCDRALFGPHAGLQRVEEREAQGLLKLVVADELDVRGLPEVVEERPLRRE